MGGDVGVEMWGWRYGGRSVEMGGGDRTAGGWRWGVNIGGGDGGGEEIGGRWVEMFGGDRGQVGGDGCGDRGQVGGDGGEIGTGGWRWGWR